MKQKIDANSDQFIQDWHEFYRLTHGETTAKIFAAGMLDGIGVFASWTLKPDGSWSVRAMDSEGGVWEDLVDFGEEECVPPEPPDSLLNPEPEDPWQPIETAPKDGARVMVWCPECKDDEIQTCYWSTSLWVTSGGAWIVEEMRSDTMEYHPTHWMPLPPAPSSPS